MINSWFHVIIKFSYILIGKFTQNNPTYSRFSYNNPNYRLTMNNPNLGGSFCYRSHRLTKTTLVGALELFATDLIDCFTDSYDMI